MSIDKVWLLVLAATEFASLMVQSLDPMVDGGRSRGEVTPKPWGPVLNLEIGDTSIQAQNVLRF